MGAARPVPGTEGTQPRALGRQPGCTRRERRAWVRPHTGSRRPLSGRPVGPRSVAVCVQLVGRRACRPPSWPLAVRPVAVCGVWTVGRQPVRVWEAESGLPPGSRPWPPLCPPRAAPEPGARPSPRRPGLQEERVVQVDLVNSSNFSLTTFSRPFCLISPSGSHRPVCRMEFLFRSLRCSLHRKPNAAGCCYFWR